MHLLNDVLPRFSSPVHQPGGKPAPTGLNEVESALAAIHQNSAERIAEIVFWLKALVTSAFKRLWQHLGQHIGRPLAAWLQPRFDWQYDHYLQGAADCADLEYRMRNWDRRQRGWL